jgi:hypothetical protein
MGNSLQSSVPSAVIQGPGSALLVETVPPNEDVQVEQVRLVPVNRCDSEFKVLENVGVFVFDRHASPDPTCS